MAREEAKRQKSAQRRSELAKAANEVNRFTLFVEAIKGLHKSPSSKFWDWAQIHELADPKLELTRRREENARNKLNKYKAGFFTNLLGRENKVRAKLAKKVEVAKQKDADKNLSLQVEYEKKYAEWEHWNQFSANILSGDLRAYQVMLAEYNPFSQIFGLKVVEVAFERADCAIVRVTVDGPSIVPLEFKKLTPAGNLSSREMPKGLGHEIYQDYVCSAALRVSQELFQLLPLETVCVNCQALLLKASTGHLEDQTILSVCIPRETLYKLNPNQLDPSASMVNFNHRMNFKKTMGMLPVEPLCVSEAEDR